MKILFLVESLDNQTAQNLVNELNKTGNIIHVISYFSNNQDQCEINIIDNKISLKCNNIIYSPEDYDAAFLWCWGTAPLGRKYLRLFEDQGVTVLNSTYKTEITDSKILFAKALKQANAPMPKTLCFEPNTSINDIDFDSIQKQLGAPPYVFKPDYGTQGFGVYFAFTEHDIRTFAKNLRKTNTQNNGFIVQEFIGDPNVVISHYRALVIGDWVLPTAIKISAQDTLQVSNICGGGIAELVAINSELKKAALLAAKTSGLNVAGVDLMVRSTGKKDNIVILEVNDGPGTKTFDRKGVNASKVIIDYFIDTIESQKTDGSSNRLMISS